MRWKFSTGGPILSSPVLDSIGDVIVEANDGYLYEIAPGGTQKWKFPLGSLPATASFSPVIAPSTGVIYALGVGYQSGIGSAQSVLYAVNSDGSQRWKLFTEQSTASPVIDANGTIYVSGHENNHQVYTLLAVNPSGTPKWQFVTGSTVADALNSTPAIAADGTIYFTTQKNLVAVNPDGTLKWYLPIATNGSSPAVGPDGTIYLGSTESKIYALNPDGTIQWSYFIGSPIWCSPAVGSNGIITVGALDGYLYGFMRGGSLLWSFNTGNAIVSSPVKGADGTSYVFSGVAGGSANAFAVGIPGIKVWKTVVGEGVVVSAPAIGQDGALYVGLRDGSLVCVGTEVNTVPISNFVVTPVSTLGGGGVVGTVTLSKNAPAGGDVVNLIASNSSANPPPFVVVPAGSNSISFTIGTSAVSKATDVTVTAGSGGLISPTLLTIVPADLSNVSITPATVTAMSPSTLTVRFNGPIGPKGATIALTSGNAAVQVPATAAAYPGDLSIDVPITTSGVTYQTKVVITASMSGISKSVTLTVNPPSLLSINLGYSEVVGGTSITGSVLLNGPAGPGGLSVSLLSSSSAVKLPASVVVPAGSSKGTFPVNTTPVAAKVQAVLSAFASGVSKSTSLTLDPVSLASLSVVPATVEGSAQVTGTLSLNGPAPVGGLTVKLSSNLKAVALPASVKVAQNQTSVSFAVKPSAVASTVVATLTATLKSSAVAGLIMVNPPYLLGVKLNSTNLRGGNAAQGTVTLSSAAPVGGLVLKLFSDSGAAKVPQTITVAAGKTSAVFSLKSSKVVAATTVTVRATLGTQTRTASLTINP